VLLAAGFAVDKVRGRPAIMSGVTGLPVVAGALDHAAALCVPPGDMKEDVLVRLPSTITALVRNAFLVRLDHNGHMLRARISGRMEQRHVRVAVGEVTYDTQSLASPRSEL
jgi:translation initiation factor IF-1